jgi:hypothetical protein
MTSSWLDLVPVCDGFTYNAAMICEDCAAKTIEHLEAKGIEDTGDSDDFPQGPFPNSETDTPDHCDNGAHCVNAVKIPGGKKIGCPLSCILTQHGVEETRRSIALHILFGSAHQKAVGRLWWHLFHSSLNDGPILKLTSDWAPLPAPIKKELPQLTNKPNHLLHETYTDLENVYGGAVSHGEHEDSLILWRLAINDAGKLSSASTPSVTVQLPLSELQARSLETILTEAINDGAWY